MGIRIILKWLDEHVSIAILLFFTVMLGIAWAADEAINTRTELAEAPAENDILVLYDTTATAGRRVTTLNLLNMLEAARTDYEIHIDNISSNLKMLDAITYSANMQTFFAAANYAAMQTLLSMPMQADCSGITAGICLDTDNGNLYSWDGDSVELVGVLNWQPLDSDLTSLAALTTDAFGRGLIELTTAAALLSAAGVVPVAATINTIDDCATTELFVGGGAGVAPVCTTATGTGTPVRAGSPELTGSPTVETSIDPAGAGVGTLGSASKEWSELYLKSGGIIKGEDDQSNTITSSGTGWIFNKPITTTGSTTPGILNATDTDDPGDNTTAGNMYWDYISGADGSEIYDWILQITIPGAENTGILRFDGTNKRMNFPYPINGGSYLQKSVGADELNLDCSGTIILSNSASSDATIPLPASGLCGGVTDYPITYYLFNNDADADNDLDVVPNGTDYVYLDGASCGAGKGLELEEMGEWAILKGYSDTTWMVIAHSGAECEP